MHRTSTAKLSPQDKRRTWRESAFAARGIRFICCLFSLDTGLTRYALIPPTPPPLARGNHHFLARIPKERAFFYLYARTPSPTDLSFS